jgi:hypothetical protein
LNKHSSKREEQIRGVIESTAGMYGDLQGIAGKGLNEIEGLQLTTLPAGEDETSARWRVVCRFPGIAIRMYSQ